MTTAGKIFALSPPSLLVGNDLGQIAADPAGRYMHAVCGNNISSFSVAEDGTLRPVGSPVTAGGGVTTIVLAPKRRLLFAATRYGTIAAFALAHDGALASSPRISDVYPGAQTAFAMDRKERALYWGYNGALCQARISQDGSLIPFSPLVFDGGSFGELLPSPNGRFLYASHYLGDRGAVRQYHISADGSLHFLTRDDVMVNLPSMLMHPSGNVLYTGGATGNTSATDGLWRYDILPDGRIQKFWPMRVVAGGLPDPLAVVSRGEFLLYARNASATGSETLILRFAISGKGIPEVVAHIKSGLVAFALTHRSQ